MRLRVDSEMTTLARHGSTRIHGDQSIERFDASKTTTRILWARSSSGVEIKPLRSPARSQRCRNEGQVGRYQLLIFFLRSATALRSRCPALSRGIRILPLRISSGRALKFVEWTCPSQWLGASFV